MQRVGLGRELNENLTDNVTSRPAVTSHLAVTSLPVNSPGAGFTLLSGTNSHMNTAEVIHLLRTRTPEGHTHAHTHIRLITFITIKYILTGSYRIMIIT